ncbi:MAG TPA: flagellar FlbD family protein [Planctomycetota bacterium]|nr:flagellar FlbD family protein [Planctomycetota bacterium]
MIEVTRLDDRTVIINADLIKFVERTPDTIVTLTTGDKIIVRETPEQVVGRVIEYGRQLRIYPQAS